VCGLDPVHHIVKHLLPHAKGADWGAVRPEATEHKVYYFPVEARRGVALKLSHWSLGEVGHDVVQDFRQGRVLALAAGLTKLPLMDQLPVDLMMHGATSEVNATQQVTVGFEKVNHAEFIQFDDACFFVDHNVHNLYPSTQVKCVSRSRRGETVDEL
jgi:hypothetical protein